MKPGMKLTHWIWSSAAALTALLPSIATATLGEPESSIKAESQLSQGSLKETDRGSYRLHEIQLTSGALVREYAGLDGKVFAVTWRGPFAPNLKQILGRYFDEYSAAAQSARLDRNHVQVRQTDLVVQVGGHMRAYGGRAYLPEAMPSGVSSGDLE